MLAAAPFLPSGCGPGEGVSWSHKPVPALLRVFKAIWRQRPIEGSGSQLAVEPRLEETASLQSSAFFSQYLLLKLRA